MTHLSSQAFGTILDHLADVIEGGNAYAGGDSYRGVPGTHSSDKGLRTGTDGTFVASGTPTTTTIQHPTGDWTEGRWVRSQSAGFFIVDDSQSAARRITAWDNGSKTFTTDAFPAAPTGGATMRIRQGFKRHPNHVDIEDDENGVDEGYDRTFTLDLIPGADLEFYGAGNRSTNAVLMVRLRILQHSRLRDARKSAVENIVLISEALRMGGATDRPNHRDGTYIRAILPPDSEPEYDVDSARVVVTMRLPLIYRIATTFA